eukprot:PhM_4_TR11993/c0_g1_i1/m.63797
MMLVARRTRGHAGDNRRHVLEARSWGVLGKQVQGRRPGQRRRRRHQLQIQVQVGADRPRRTPLVEVLPQHNGREPGPVECPVDGLQCRLQVSVVEPPAAVPRPHAAVVLQHGGVQLNSEPPRVRRDAVDARVKCGAIDEGDRALLRRTLLLAPPCQTGLRHFQCNVPATVDTRSLLQGREGAHIQRICCSASPWVRGAQTVDVQPQRGLVPSGLKDGPQHSVETLRVTLGLLYTEGGRGAPLGFLQHGVDGACTCPRAHARAVSEVHEGLVGRHGATVRPLCESSAHFVVMPIFDHIDLLTNLHIR